MDKKELRKKIIAGAVILGAFVGTVWGAASYWTGGAFQPGENERALRNNQVLFDDQKSSLSQEGGDNGDSFWEDQNADSEVSGNQQAGYLFTPDELTPEATTAGIVGPDSGSTANGTDRPSTGIDITTRPNGTTGTVVGGTGGGNTGTGTGGGATQPTTPSITGDGTLSNPYQGGTVLPDPGEEKQPPSGLLYDDPIHITDRINIPLDGTEAIFISAPFGSSAPSLYKGQVVDNRTIFASMDSYLIASDGNVYYWSNTDLGKLIRIDAISFDQNAWIDMTGSTTVTIPLEATNMYIRVSYRYKTNGAWISYSENPVVYPLKDARVLLLNTTVKDESKIKQSQLLNPDNDLQNMAVGTLSNLSAQLQRLVVQREKVEGSQVSKDPVLKNLFPGWTENGQTVPWRYTVTPGRHVLQAPKSVSYDTKNYRIVLRFYWMMDDYSLVSSSISPSRSLSYLQALTAYNGKATELADGTNYLKALRPPMYTQAVDLSRNSALTVDTLSIPSTVLYVNADGIGKNGMGLRVSLGYEADAGNPRYTAKDGILYNKDGTEILGVPTALETLTVPEGVTSVYLPYGCSLNTLTVPTKNAEAFPDVNFDRLPYGSTLLVDESVLETVLRSKADTLRSANLYIASIQDPNTVYRVHDNLILSQEETLHGVLDTDVRWLSVSENVTGLEENCLMGLDQLTMVHLPASGKALTLEKGCFGSAPKLETIVCYSQAQYAAAKAVAPEGVHVLLAGAAETNGYRYLDMGDGQIMLLNVPSDITEFTGVIPGSDGGTVTVTAIGNDVFSGCLSLRWVDLAPQVTAIGQNAFRGCTGLEGVVIGATDDLMIGQGAFDGCTALRFLASNALHCDLRSPDLTLPCSADAAYAFLFSPMGGQGYNPNWLYFGEEDNLTAFVLKDCGGTKVLYGLTDEDAWLAIRSGGTIDGDVTLPLDTEVIHTACFLDAKAPAGHFDLNWQELDSLAAINAAAFQNSDLGPDVVLPPDLNLRKDAFRECTALKSIVIPEEEALIQLPGELFSGCTGLTTVTIGQLNPQSAINNGLFNGCSNLRELIFTGAPPRLSIYELGNHFHFNALQWGSDEAEEAHLHVTVPEDLEEEFINEWRCGFLGYPGNHEQTGYQTLWQGVCNEMYNASDEEIFQEVERRLLVGENHVRALLGMEKADTAFHHFTYTVDAEGMITLTGANDAEYIELTAATLDMPLGWTLDYIGPKAFQNSPRLMQVTLPESLLGIYNEPFAGVECPPKDKLQVVLSGTPLPSLLGFEEGVPFDFGIPDDAIRFLYLSSGDLEEILKAWVLPMTGYNRLNDLILGKMQGEYTAETLTRDVLDTLFTAEKRLRTMLELDPISDPQEMVGIPQEEVISAISLLLTEDFVQPPIPEEDPEPTEDAPTLPTEAPEETVPTEVSEETAPTEPLKEEGPEETQPAEPQESAPQDTEAPAEP